MHPCALVLLYYVVFCRLLRRTELELTHLRLGHSVQLGFQSPCAPPASAQCSLTRDYLVAISPWEAGGGGLPFLNFPLISGLRPETGEK